MFGDDLIIAPVIEPGVKEHWGVYLPEGTWVSLYDKTNNYAGPGKLNIPAAPGQIPVLYRRHSKWTELFLKVGEIANKALPLFKEKTAEANMVELIADSGNCDSESCDDVVHP